MTHVRLFHQGRVEQTLARSRPPPAANGDIAFAALHWRRDSVPDPTTILGPGTLFVGAGVYVTQDLLLKLLGPTFHYLGGELQEFVEKRKANVGKICLNAVKKLGDKLNSPGQVPPKVLKTIISEGSYSDDTVAVEYFGGVLASSRTEVSRDDRGARIAKVIDNLSAYQIRTHYLIYSTISELYSNGAQSFNHSESRAKMKLFIPFQGYAEAMDFTKQEWDNPQMLNHIFHGLRTDGLIEGGWAFGNQEELRAFFDNVPGNGIVCTPSAHGVELLLWAFGHGDQELDFALTPEFSPEIISIPRSVPNSLPLKDT